MGLPEFVLLGLDERAAVVYGGRVDHFLHFRLDGQFRILLYDMGAFFAEVWYNAKSNEIEEVRGFDSSDLDALGKYADYVSLGSLRGLG